MRYFFILILGLCLQFGFTQDIDLSKEIPSTSKVRMGTLENGLKYYIRANQKPKNIAELQLVINVGSILETDDQRGIAHFLEHMNFNGTRKYPKNKLIDFLESIGVEFGAHINASTGFDETIYRLSIPTDDESKVDKSLEILQEWAFHTTLDETEVQKEKGVVIEEYRMGLGASKRMFDKTLPIILKDSKYAHRLAIGKVDVIKTFTAKHLRKFRDDWYRPNLMGIVVVGDIDVDIIEAKIKRLFAPYKNKEGAPQRSSFEVPDHKEVLVSIVDDIEALNTDFQIFNKQDGRAEKNNTYAYLRYQLTHSLFNYMLNERYFEISKKTNPPFMYAYSNYGSFIRGKNTYVSSAQTKEKEIFKGFKAVLVELEKVKRYGFKDTEFERAKKTILSSVESAFENRESLESNVFAGECVQHFLTGDSMIDIEVYFETAKILLPTISLNEVNDLANGYTRKSNRVIVFQSPKKEGLKKITEEEVFKIVEEIEHQKIEDYEDKVSGKDLMTHIPKAGKILSEETNEKLDITIFKLSNGARVVCKHTDFRKDEIRFSGFSKGGWSLISDEDFHKVIIAFRGLSEAGLNGHSVNDLSKLMAGRIAYVDTTIGDISEEVSGSCRPNDMETMFQLIYLNFTALNKNKEVFDLYIQKERENIKNSLSSPFSYFVNQYRNRLNGHNKRFIPDFPKDEYWENLDYNLAYKLYMDRLSNASNFTFFVIGNYDKEELKNNIETYLASLPTKNKKEIFRDDKERPISPADKIVIRKGIEEKSLVLIQSFFDTAYSQDEQITIDALSHIVNIKLLEKLREEDSGVYNVNFGAMLTKFPYSDFSYGLSFLCAPDNVDKLIEASSSLLAGIVKDGVDEKDLDKFKESQKIAYKEGLEDNDYWSNKLFQLYFFDIDSSYVLDYLEKLEAVSIDDVHQIAKKYLTKQKVVAYLLPKENKK